MGPHEMIIERIENAEEAGSGVRLNELDTQALAKMLLVLDARSEAQTLDGEGMDDN